MKAAIDALKRASPNRPKSVIDALQAQVDAIDVKLAKKHDFDTASGPTLAKNFQENEGVQKLLRDKKGSAVISLNGKEAADLMSRRPSSVALRLDLRAPIR